MRPPQVGDKYPWYSSKRVLEVTAVKTNEVKFEVRGQTPMSGSMSLSHFVQTFKKRI